MRWTQGCCQYLLPFLNLQADMLSAEELSGDNQYHCDFCGKKVDATRQLCLRQLPPYVCLSLQRFVFDMKVGTSSINSICTEH